MDYRERENRGKRMAEKRLPLKVAQRLGTLYAQMEAAKTIYSAALATALDMLDLDASQPLSIDFTTGLITKPPIPVHALPEPGTEKVG